MTSPIGSVSQLVSLIQTQLATHGSLKAPRQSLSKKKQPLCALETRIQLRIRSIDAQDPLRGRKAFRVFLESILLSHLGEPLMNDPKFYQLVDRVQLALETDPEIGRLIETAIQHLIPP